MSLEVQQNVWFASMLIFRTKRSRTLISVLLLVWMTAISAPRYASAQAANNASPRKTWATLQVDKAQQSKNERNARNILRNPREPVNAENTEILENYLRRYFFARMTVEGNLSELPQYRLETRERCGWTGTKDTSDAGEEMNRITSSVMHALCNGVFDATVTGGDQQSVIVIQESVRDSNNQLRVVRTMADLKSADRIFNLTGDLIERNEITELAPSTIDFHPAVKLNAMLVLGDLNDKQPRKGRPETAEPRLNTQMDLIAYLESPEILTDTLLVGALTGMQRHTHESLDSEQKKRIAKVVLKLVNPQIVSGRNPAAGLWIRRQAIDILGQLALPNTENFLLKVIEAGNEPVLLRIAAVEAIGQLKLKGLTPATISRFGAGLAQLAADACWEELAAARSPRSSFSPDRLRMRLMAVQSALLGSGEDSGNGLMAIAPAEEGKSLEQLVDTLKTVDGQIQTLTVSSDRKRIEDVVRDGAEKFIRLTEAYQEV